MKGQTMPQTTVFEVRGKLIHMFEVQQITDTFSKRAVVIRVPHDKYPQEVKIECVGNAKNDVDSIPRDTYVIASCELTGKAYTRKNDGQTDWFTSVKCFSIQPDASKAKGTDAVQTIMVEDIKDVPF